MGRRIDVLSAVLAGVTGLQVSHTGEDWQQVWEAFLTVRESNPAAAVERARTMATGLDDPLRMQLLEAVSGVEGAVDVVLEALPEFGSSRAWPLTTVESWIAAEVLPAGEKRSMSVLSALKQEQSGLEPGELTLAHEVAVEAAEDLRFEEALALQRVLHDRCSAEWSAGNLAMTLQRMGAYGEAREVLVRQEERSASAYLRAQRGVLSLAFGDEAGGRSILGSCLGLGSLDAAQVLARLDLACGRRTAARRAFGALLTSAEPGPWALYGWGLSLVETPLGPSSALVTDER